MKADKTKTKAHEALEKLTPREIVSRLDAYIIGQGKAKRSVAIALRNRTRRLNVAEDVRDDIVPKNILMIGPTGVGKTEIARRLAKLVDAPFIKVEATKYTEVGYVGRDVESMVRDLAVVAANMVRSEMHERLKKAAEHKVENELLDLLMPKKRRGAKKSAAIKIGEFPIGLISDLIPGRGQPVFKAEDVASDDSDDGDDNDDDDDDEDTDDDYSDDDDDEDDDDRGTQGDREAKDPTAMLAEFGAAIAKAAGDAAADAETSEKDAAETAASREALREQLARGDLNDRIVEINVRQQHLQPMEIVAGGSIEDLESAMQSIMQAVNGGGRGRKKSVTVEEARRILLDEQLDRMIDPEKLSEEARKRAQEMGIIFIDEIDKIAVKDDRGGGDVSREGVQRDILPIVEGSTVNTKFGVIDTTHILFIAAGAFTLSKPSDLIPELQGRFPLRVELDSLHKEEFKRILLEPKNAITKQYAQLLGTEKVTLEFTEESIDRMAQLAEEVNSKSENIGARRLHTIMETVLDDISFDADLHPGETITVDAIYVDDRLKDIVKDQDLSRYIL
jgi:ATP-dependent HslUV protease ATP-binding subunit HslU